MSDRDPRAELASLSAALEVHLEREGRRGRRHLAAPTGPAAAASPPAPAPRPAATPEPAAPPRAVAAAPARSAEVAGPGSPAALAPGCADLDALRQAVAGCTACELCQTRKQTVFADGDGSAGVMFVGEAPGADEDDQGVPFVGRAGQLLTDIVVKGMKLDRRDVYIANVLKCRPPGNRDPRPGEKDLCTPWLERQIELVAPRVIVTLGRHASMHLLKTEASMGRMRGRVHSVGGRQVVPTYHPAFLLRSPHMKRDCWQDIQQAMELLEGPA